MRLIDADALDKDLKESYKVLGEFHKGLTFGEERRVCEARLATFRECVVRIHKAPTVDINTEVAREIFAEIEENIRAKINSIPIDEWEDDYFTGERCALIRILSEITELKNKYTKEGVGE